MKQTIRLLSTLLMLLVMSSVTQAADEAERQVWGFNAQNLKRKHL